MEVSKFTVLVICCLAIHINETKGESIDYQKLCEQKYPGHEVHADVTGSLCQVICKTPVENRTDGFLRPIGPPINKEDGILCDFTMTCLGGECHAAQQVQTCQDQAQGVEVIGIRRERCLFRCWDTNARTWTVNYPDGTLCAWGFDLRFCNQGMCLENGTKPIIPPDIWGSAPSTTESRLEEFKAQCLATVPSAITTVGNCRVYCVDTKDGYKPVGKPFLLDDETSCGIDASCVDNICYENYELQQCRKNGKNIVKINHDKNDECVFECEDNNGLKWTENSQNGKKCGSSGIFRSFKCHYGVCTN